MNLLWIIAAILIAVWLVGLALDVVGALIHVLLVIAVAVAIVAFIKRRV